MAANFCAVSLTANTLSIF
ncbi:MAG: hypothetical protein EAZ07_10075 [Cytophagales bacterium]|nr:MAG: hypothetical protein EAZ07_10075 [Cytophagales bacterium]